MSTSLSPTLSSEGPSSAGDGAGYSESPYGPDGLTPEERRNGEEGLWWILRTLYAKRWTILAATVLTGILSVLFSLTLPLWYRAESRVLLPQTGGSSMLSMLDNVVPGASKLLDGGGADYTRYLSILTSRTVLDRTVEEFDLETVYETQDDVDPRGAAIKALLGNSEFTVALDFDYLSVAVFDQDPRRAAEITNFMVEELNRAHVRLRSSNARSTRISIGNRLEEAQTALDSAKSDMQAFQELHGVVDVERQGEAFFGVLAEARASEAQLEVQYEMLRSQYGDEHPQVQAAAAAVSSARREVARALSGGDALMPVPLRDLPEVGRRYADLYQEVMTQAKIVEFIMPLYEQARFDEEREATAVQVLDEAIPPKRKAKPKRAFVVIGLTGSVAILLCLFLLARAWWRSHAATLAARLRAA